jgi:hypothetical protein
MSGLDIPRKLEAIRKSLHDGGQLSQQPTNKHLSMVKNASTQVVQLIKVEHTALQ